MAKSLLSILLLFISYINYGQQTLEFVDVEDLPEKKSALAYANNDSDIYVVNGFTDTLNFSSTIHKYNLESKTWTLVNDSGIPKRFAAAEIVGDKLYIFNGLKLGFINSSTEVIDLNTFEISTTTINPNPTKSGGSAVWNGEIYSFGGLTSPKKYSNKLIKFNPVSQEWTDVSEMPIAAELKGEIIDGKLYVIGGYNGSVSKEIYIYDIEKDQWESPFTMPFGLSAVATTTSGSKIWLVGDYASLSFLGYFDTSDNSFHVLSSNMIPRRHCATASINGSLFVIGGNTKSDIGTSMSSVQKADLKINDIDINVSESIVVFPNPTSDILNFNAEIKNISIYSANGQLLQKMNGSFKQIHVKDYPTGTYFIKGSLRNKNISMKWSKL